MMESEQTCAFVLNPPAVRVSVYSLKVDVLKGDCESDVACVAAVVLPLPPRTKRLRYAYNVVSTRNSVPDLVTQVLERGMGWRVH